MGWSATELLNQQDHTELCKKTSSLCEKLGADTLNTSWNKLFLQGFKLLASCDSLQYHISTFSFDFNTSTVVKIVIFIVIVLHGRVVV